MCLATGNDSRFSVYAKHIICMETKKQTARPISYLGLINQFWRIDKTRQFSPAQTRVFFYLLDVANATGWPRIFEHSDKRAAANCGMGVMTFKNARAVLFETRLLSYSSGGHGHANKTRYSFSDDLCPDTQGNMVASPSVKNVSENITEDNLQGDAQSISNPSPLNNIEIKTEIKTSSSEDEYLILNDGIERNFYGLKAHLENMRATEDERKLIFRLTNYGQIGNPVWKAIAEIRRSEGKIKQPIRFIISRLLPERSIA